MAWHNLFSTIKPYLIRIETPAGSGTGFLFGFNADQTIAAVATAWHVVAHEYEWKSPIKLIHHNSNKELFLKSESRVILLDRKRDSASILLLSSELPFPKEVLPLMDPGFFKKVGVEVGWVGFPSVAYPELCFFSGTVSAFLAKDDCYLIDGVAINGVSGGPVFAAHKDGGPSIIGSVSAYMPNRVGGSALPGLLRAQDISSFQATLKKIRSLEEAKKKEAEEAKKEKTEPPAGESKGSN